VSWQLVELSEVAAPRGMVGGPFGSSLVSKDYRESGIPVIRGVNMSSGKFISGDFVYVTPLKADSDLSRNQASPGDIVFTQRGTLGQVALVPEVPFDRYVVSQSQMRLTVNPEFADTEFVYYACKSPEFLKQVNDNAISTGVPHINLGILGRLRIPLPPVSQQRAVAQVLGALDDKIAVNRKLSRKVDELSFSCYLAMVEDAMSIPLSSAAQFVNGKPFTKGASGTGRVVIRIAELNSGIGPSTVRSDIEVDDRYIAQPGDILFAWSGSLTLHRWFRGEAIVNQHIFKVIPHQEYPAWLVYQMIAHKMPYFKDIAADKATTMGHIQRKHLDEPVPVPSPEKIQEHDELMTALWGRALLAEQESEKLEALRDALLPHLMSGELRVRDAEGLVSESV